MRIMSEIYRKCYKCGLSPSVDPTIYLFRFPRPGIRNIQRCELWAKYSNPDDDWASPVFQQKLYSEHKIFKETSFINFNLRKLHRFAVPNDESEKTMAAVPKVIVVNNRFPEAGLELLKSKVDIRSVQFEEHEAESLPEIKNQIAGVDAIIWNTKHKLNKEIIDLVGPQLKAVTTMSSGTDQIDVEELKRRNIPLGNTPRVLDDAVADIAVGLLIAAARRFKEGVTQLENGTWKYGVQWLLGQDVSGSTVGIVGLGGVGQAVVQRLKGFQVGKFLYCGRSEKPEAKALGADYVSLTELLTKSDFVILSCPLTEKTRHLINAQTLLTMKNTAVLINVARGEVIDQEALLSALNTRSIFAAGLDVTTPEPLPNNHPLVSHPNCYMLPHLGSATIQTRNEMAKISAANILLALNSDPMMCPAY